MDNNKLKRWCSLVAFLVLAGISCWATEHSFHLLIKWIPQVFVWMLTIAFFILASYGSKLFVDSLNKDNFEEHRRRKFWIGISLIAIFWLFMSMPTNTHTFFYNHKIADVLQDDVATTRGYVSQISERANIYPEAEYQALYNQVDDEFALLQKEFEGIKGSEIIGNGPHVRTHIENINKILEPLLSGTSIIFDDSSHGSKDTRILSEYKRQKDEAMARILDNNYKVPRNEALRSDTILTKLSLIDNKVSKLKEGDGFTEEFITEADGVISTGYASIKNNADFVKFKTQEDKKRHTSVNPETKTKRMLSVIDVWGDFLGGKYPTSFIFYVLISILVDIAAFMFFNFAFKKED